MMNTEKVFIYKCGWNHHHKTSTEARARNIKNVAMFQTTLVCLLMQMN